MSEDAVSRKLTAILYADVVGYSRLTEADELGAHRRVMSALDFATESIKASGGTVLRYAGDAILAEFPSVVATANASVAIQNELHARNKDIPEKQRVSLRIGINLGEVLEDRGEIFGDGVNLAAPGSDRRQGGCRVRRRGSPGIQEYRQARSRLSLAVGVAHIDSRRNGGGKLSVSRPGPTRQAVHRRPALR
jgi:adenylate cyclase